MSSTIYDIDFGTQAKIMIRYKYRLPKFLSWFRSLLYPLDWLRLYRLKGYKYGISDVPVFNPSTVYDRGDLVLWTDGAVYVRATVYEDVYPSGILPTDGYVAGKTPPSKYWIKVIDSFVGVDERINYTCTVLSLEYMLNRWFSALNPSEYPTGFWPTDYPDKYDGDLNRPKIYIEQKQADVGVFFVGLDEDSSSSVGLDDSVFVGMDYVGLDDSVSGSKYGMVVRYPLSLIAVPTDNDPYYPTYQTATDPKFFQIESLINKHKHWAIDHAYKSY